MDQLTNDIIQTIISYMIPQRDALLDGIDPTRIFNITHQCTPEPDADYIVRYNKENGLLYMEKEDEILYCVDFNISSITLVLVQYKWEKCWPDNTAMEYMLSFHDKYDQDRICINKHPVIVDYLLKHPHNIKWKFFSMNPNPIAVNYLLQHTDRISWLYFCQNHSMEAVEYLIQHPEHIEWFIFSQHPFIYKKVDDIVTQIEWYNMMIT